MFQPFELSENEFRAFSELIYAKAGISLHHGKKELVRARLAKRIRESGFNGFRDYYDFVISDESGEELVHLLDEISTNLTSFFREPKHFEFMKSRFLPEIHKKGLQAGKRRLRIWSAGCSTGEEPYSIVMTVLEYAGDFREWDFRILATDISTRVLQTAESGVYLEERLDAIPLAARRTYFLKGRGASEGLYKVSGSLKSHVVFRRFNLMDALPFKRPFDLIFCRNVMIYFDKKTQADLVQKFHQALAPGGYLFIGHSESLSGINHSFGYVQPTIYRK